MNATPDPLNRRTFITSSSLAALTLSACGVLPRGLIAASPADGVKGGGRDASGGAKGGAVLRYYIPPADREEHLAELIRTSKQVGIEEVLLFTTEYLGNSQFKEIGELERICEHLSLCAERLQAAGIVELIALVLQMRGGFIHGTAALTDPIAEDLWLVGPATIARPIRLGLSNSFGFGSIGTSIAVANMDIAA